MLQINEVKIYGQVLAQEKFPKDLFIPPQALAVFLQNFEGPLDLLLYLIRKQNFNIFDIPIKQITRQYLDYVEIIRHHNLPLASEYLVMAAILINIKSRLLLPKIKSDEDTEELSVEQDLEALSLRLLEYEQFKQEALKIEKMPVLYQDFLVADVSHQTQTTIIYPDVELNELLIAWQELLERQNLQAQHKITKEQLSVQEYMGKILRFLHHEYKIQGKTEIIIPFQQLWQSNITDNLNINSEYKSLKPLIVVYFVALLELLKEQLIIVSQTENFDTIYLKLGYEIQENENQESKNQII